MRLKSIAITALAAAAAVLPTYRAYAAPPATRASAFQSADYLYRFQIPAGWVQKTDMPRPTVAFLGPEDNGFTANLTVSLYLGKAEPADLAKFANGIKLDHAVISQKHACKLGGLPAIAWRTQLNLPGHPAAENRQVVCIYNHRAYELAFTCAAGKMKPVYDSVCDSWLASFSWLANVKAPHSR